MNEQQINTAIAEACGRRRNPKGGWYPGNGWEFGTQGILNYCADLNAMHEAEKVLIQNNNWRIGEYEARLFNSVGEMNNVSSWRGVKLCFHATARQRAEAFLRTLGKWEEA